MAKEESYFAECISLAEVRASLQAGYLPQQIVLTGPGKFWEAYDRDPHSVYEQLKRRGEIKLRAIYADSLADLQRILNRITDPKDFLRCHTVGVRFQPVCLGNHSRFGVSSNKPELVRALADVIRRRMPPGLNLGVHLHFASSAPGTGQRKWLGMARGAVHLAMDFAKLCGQPLAVMDFGGGWNTHFMENADLHDELTNLLALCATESDQVSEALSSPPPSPSPQLSIMFELGKCVTERGGGLISRVMEIRELDVEEEGDSSCPIQSIQVGGGPLRVKSRALILDTTVGELSIPHLHPLFWRSANCGGAPGAADWQSISRLGKDELWGRTCMEFDLLVGKTNGWGGGRGTCGYGCAGVQIPPGLQVGDFVLIGGCGAYDMSMQYDFGDGRGRERCLVSP